MNSEEYRIIQTNPSLTNVQRAKQQKKYLESAKEITVDAEIRPTTARHYKLRCNQFPDVYVMFTPPLTSAKIAEFVYSVKCAFLDKNIILRSDVFIIVNITNE